jgi:hypothetical protein
MGSRLQALAVLVTAMTMGLVALVAVAAFAGPIQPGGAVLASTGRPAAVASPSASPSGIVSSPSGLAGSRRPSISPSTPRP